MSDSKSSFFPQFGGLAIVAAVLAAVWGTKSSTSPPTPAASDPALTKAAGPEVKPPVPEPVTLETKLTEFEVLERPEKGVNAPGAVKSEVRFLIMTVPDPVETQFGTRFDQAIDALCRAMADVTVVGRESGTFTLERYWYPWPEGGKKSDPKAGAAAHLQFPGVVLFRGGQPKYKWVVLLVGESPTAGVHPAAFRAALDMAERERPGTASIRIVGPNFSGSQALMLPLLKDWQGDKGRPIRAVSGTAFGLRQPPSTPGIEFRLTHAPTVVLNSAILHYLARTGDAAPGDRLPGDPLHPNPPPDQTPPLDRVAYLVESNSGYGNLSANTVKGADGGPSPWILRFPMHLSRLSGIQTQAVREREEQLGLAVPGSSALKKLDEKRKGEDLLPSADETRTALVNQRLLGEYWETLRRERVRYVGILASDVRDKIFLIAQLRKEVPNAILFVHGLDLQLAHPEYLSQTRGILAVSSYPLYPIAQQWAKRTPDPRRVPFASSGAAATYNAILVQCESDRLLDYRAPAATDPAATTPAVWVSTVGDDGTIVPLAYFTNYDPGIMHRRDAAEPAVAARPPQPGPLRHLMLGLIAAAVVGGVVIRRAFGKSPAGPDAVLVRRLKYQYATLVGAGLLLGGLPLGVYFYDLARLHPGGRSIWTSGADAVFLGFALVIGGAFALFGLFSLPCQLFPRFDRRNLLGGKRGRYPADAKAIPLVPPPGKWAERVPLFLHIGGALMVATVLIAVLTDVATADPGKRLLFLERAANLGAGCSPILAGGFVALGLFLYGVLALKLLRLQTDYRVASPYPRITGPQENPMKPHADILNRIAEHAERMNGLVLGWWTLMRRKGRTFLVAIAVAGFVLALPPLTRRHGTWEGGAWDAAFLVGILTLFVLAVISTFRVYAVWRELDRLLRLIGRVPMVGAFDRLPAEATRVFSQYLLSGRRRGEDILIPHALLVRIARTTPGATPTPADPVPQAIRDRLENVRLTFATVGAPATAGPDGTAHAHAADGAVQPADAVDVDEDSSVPPDLDGVQASEFSAVSQTLVKELLPGWLGRPVPEAYGYPVGTATRDEATESWRGLAEQFIAIQAVLFVAQYFHQLRLMAYLAALPAGALLMAVTSYPFMPERLILYSSVGLVAAVLGVLLWVLYRVNKSTIVSRVTKTAPGRLTLDAGLIQNFAAFVLPLLTLLVVQVGGRWRTVVEPILDVIR